MTIGSGAWKRAFEENMELPTVKLFLNWYAFGHRVQLAAETMRQIRHLMRWKAQLICRITGQLVFPSAS